MPFWINGFRHDDVDVMVSGDDKFLLVTIHDKNDSTITHYSFKAEKGLDVEHFNV